MTDAPIAGLEFRHNSDIDPAPDYLGGFAKAQRALRDETLLEAFQPTDRVAIESAKSLQRWGTTSLVLGAAALLLATCKLFIASIGHEPSHGLAWAATTSALLSILIAVILHLAKRRDTWLTARYVAERMRQWHFQSWLDGAFISLAARDADAFERERRARWGRFQQRGRAAEGARDTFVDGEDLELWHELTAYPDPVVAAEVFRAYADLRFGWQKGYFKLKRAQFARVDDLTESISRWTIFSAVALAAGEIVLLAFESGGREVPESALLALAAGAVSLAILSAALRVYRGALGLSEQRERYEMKWARLVTLEHAFHAARGPNGKLEVMRQVEIVEIEELREFLRIARKSNFLL